LELERRDGPRSSFRGFVPHLVSEGWFPRSGYHGGVEFAGCSPPRAQYGMGGVVAWSWRGGTVHGLLLVVLVLL
jgi:hypothetical protein